MDNQVITYPYVKIWIHNDRKRLLINAATWVNIRKWLCQVKETRHKRTHSLYDCITWKPRKVETLNKRRHISDCQGLGRGIHCEREQNNVLKWCGYSVYWCIDCGTDTRLYTIIRTHWAGHLKSWNFILLMTYNSIKSEKWKNILLGI